MEDWDGEHQKQLQQPAAQQKYPPLGQDTKQVQGPQHNKNYKLPQSQHSQISFDVSDQYVEQICLRREWEKKMEQLNHKFQTLLHLTLSPVLSQMKERTIYRNKSMKHSFNQLQTRTQKF